MSGKSSINSLPDELLLKIIQYVAFEPAGYFGQKSMINQHYLIDVISKISKRFSIISTDNTMWKGEVYIRFYGNGERKIRHAIDCLGQDIDNLKFFGSDLYDRNLELPNVTFSREDILALANKAKSLRCLEIGGFRLVSWTHSSIKWSLEELRLADIEMPWYVFQNMKMHQCLPNLKIFNIIRCQDESGHSITLPDLSKCTELLKFQIAGDDKDRAAYCFPLGFPFSERIPFPRGLKKLQFIKVVFEGMSNDDFDERVKGAIEKFAYNCSVECI